MNVAAADTYSVELDPDVVGAERRRQVDISQGKDPLPFENKRAHEFILDFIGLKSGVQKIAYHAQKQKRRP
jgi:hypothetical protein